MKIAIPGELVVLSSEEMVAQEASKRIANAIREAARENERITLALSGGSTPRATYTALGREQQVQWELVEWFWVDERAVHPTSEESNFRLVRETLLDVLPISICWRIHRMAAEEEDLEKAARLYESCILERVQRNASGVPMLDVVVLGIGEDGHTASLFPHSPSLHERNQFVLYVPATEKRRARMTLSPLLIQAAKRIFVLAVGESKAKSLERAWACEGSLEETPARILRGAQGFVTWIVDQKAV
ncbi:6-phosphogluconolactonase [Pajaroellobacter abortibovis]|uniref:6-phosphogluconolactonase n=1 Tax=Pajaroellobacter abortibovis TaxID=1882918 RepID=A0A1L6MX06_9BACT|nr:6-phosphogluconolactonase [Pajaroellobacter abortibovis]APS00077.1 6-phosphogluconolactonase [Pajaroellobacter abortibovis]